MHACLVETTLTFFCSIIILALNPGNAEHIVAAKTLGLFQPSQLQFKSHATDHNIIKSLPES